MRIVEIEATNLCNAACLMCPREALTRPKGHMSWETFRTVADKVLAHGQTQLFSFSGMGEPLLNSNIAKFIGHVSPHVQTILTTNGFLLSNEIINSLLEAGLHGLTLSFDGADAESYERIMVNLRFERTQDSVRRLVSMANGRLNVMANVTVSKLTKDQLPAIRARLNEMGIEHIIYSHCHSRGGNLQDSSICDTPASTLLERCDIFATTTFVAWNGSVLACCQDLAGVGVLGDLAQMTIDELAMKRARVLEEGVHFPMCPDCDDLNRLATENPPPGGSLSEWIYRLYESEDSRQAALTQALRLTESDVAELRSQLVAYEEENLQLRQLVSGYEQGRLMRLMRWMHEKRHGLGRGKP